MSHLDHRLRSVGSGGGGRISSLLLESIIVCKVCVSFWEFVACSKLCVGVGVGVFACVLRDVEILCSSTITVSWICLLVIAIQFGPNYLHFNLVLIVQPCIREMNGTDYG